MAWGRGKSSLKRERVRRAEAERREIEARVRLLHFDLAQRVVFLVLATGIGVSIAIGESDLAVASVFAGLIAGLRGARM